jgi:SulP family sulfate permease
VTVSAVSSSVQDDRRNLRWREIRSAAGTTFSSALTHAPENAAYGLMAMAPLGAAFGWWAMGLALLGSAVACAVASVVGAGRLVDDAGAALALLTTGLVAALLPHMGAPAGDAAWNVLILVALGIGAGGLLTMLLGLLRVGRIVKFTPYPVRVGLSSGIGLLLIINVAPALLGHALSSGWPSDRAVLAGALLVGLCSLAVTTLAAHARTRVPPVLIGLIVATLLHWAMARIGWGGVLGSPVGVPALPDQWFGGAIASPEWRAALAQPTVLALLGSYALTVAVVVSLDTLLAASIIDGRLRASRNANGELLAHGLANVASALVGGLPASPSVHMSVSLVTRNPRQRHIALVHAAALLLLLLAVPAVLGVLPVSAVGGVLVFLGASMISPTLWQIPAMLWQQFSRRAAQPRPAHRRWPELAANWGVTVAVALSVLLLGIGQAVLIGASFAVLLFVRSNMRDVVRQEWTGATRRSLKTRPAHLADVLRREGHRIALLELEGPLFFGTADALRARLQALCSHADVAILDLHQVREVDLTAARILFETADDWQQLGKRLVFAEWSVHDPRRALIESVADADGPRVLSFADSTDQALEQAEEQLIERLQIDSRAGEGLTLADTMIASGLSAEELELLEAEMSTHTFPRGYVLFRAGDPGDMIYISLKGEIGVRVPGTTRRLASFAPGVTMGEIAVLARAPRSAEAFAETDVTALGLSVDTFERLMQLHPPLAAKVLRNIALHLGDRVRVLTGDLAAWMSRSGAAQAAPRARPGKEG